MKGALAVLISLAILAAIALAVAGALDTDAYRITIKSRHWESPSSANYCLTGDTWPPPADCADVACFISYADVAPLETNYTAAFKCASWYELAPGMTALEKTINPHLLSEPQ